MWCFAENIKEKSRNAKNKKTKLNYLNSRIENKYRRIATSEEGFFLCRGPSQLLTGLELMLWTAPLKPFPGNNICRLN